MDPRAPLDPNHHIAIVGMACDLPLADSPEAFWRALRSGQCAIEDFDEAAMRAAGARDDELALPEYVRAGVRLTAHDQFDAAFFGLSPREAAVMDPQHRRFLQCAWAALEHAGHRPDSLERQTGVFAGAGMGWYLIRNVIGHRELVEDMGEFLVRHLSNDKDFLSTRVSYQLDLRGPSLNVQTACSTSLVAVHLACQSLIAGECDMALAGGVTHELPQGQGYRYREEEVRSPDGRCRAFDANSGGTVFGSGAGIVVLRRLGDALRDGDTVHAVIRGTAINNDGAGKAGYLAPSVDGQAEAAAQALAVAGIDADSVGYVEAHGTGTRLGDPIEIAALSQAFDGATTGQCAIGSLKTNIGHLDTAAGVAGVIKTALSLHHGGVPASLFFDAPNPDIDFARSPFSVAATHRAWPKPGPRRAAVNSLGVGGTNAFAVLEQAPREGERPVDVDDTPQSAPIVLPLSAKTPDALRARAAALSETLAASTLPLADVAWTLREGRVAMPVRGSVASRTRAEAVRALQALSQASDAEVATAPETGPSLVFAFPGQGAQRVGMARAIARTDAAVGAALQACVAELRAMGADDVVSLLLEADASPEATARLRRTEIAQPALFAVEYALAQGLLARGLTPAAMLGHSLGEYVAATLAGVFTLPAALRLMQRRGALCASVPNGAMLAVALGVDALRARLPASLDLAAMNAPEQTVVAGAEADIAAFEARLGQEGIGARRLDTSAAFHSRLLDGVLADFRAAVVVASPARVEGLRVVSTCTGQWLGADEAASPDYWVRHLRDPVRFVDALATAEKNGRSLLIEVGPGRTLSRFATARRAAALTLPVLPSDADDVAQWSNLSGLLWARGVAPDWSLWQQPMQGRRVPLPTYSFAKDRHWIAPPQARADANDATSTLPAERWLQTPVWQPAPLPRRASAALPASALVLCDGWGIGDALADALAAHGVAVRRAHRADGFTQEDSRISLDPSELAHWQALAATQAPEVLVDLWALDAPEDDFDAQRRRAFDDALRMAQGLAAWADGAALVWLSASVHAQAIGDAAALRPTQALRAGPVRTWPQEASALRACWLDLDDAALARPLQAASALLEELRAGCPDETVALRGRHRWLPHWQPLGIAPAAAETDVALAGAVLLTGAFGGAGREIAEHLALRGGVEPLWLVSRTALDAGSPRAAWVEALRVLGLDARVLVADLGCAGALAAAAQSAGLTRLDAALHAAGVLDDALIAMKSLDAAHAVLSPKLQGAREVAALAESLGASHVLYFSSISAQMGASGQVDYTAANAFLDAFAAQADARSTATRHTALAFSIWREAGMAARLAAERGIAPPPFEDGLPQAHPLLRHRRDEGDTRVFGGVVGPQSDWVLDGHRLANGDALLPGTGLLDLIAWGLQALRGAFTPFRCEGLTIAAPLVFAGGEPRQIALRFTPTNAARYDVSLGSRGAGDDEATEHVALTLTLDAESAPLPLRLEQPRSPREPRYAHPALRFGPEWDCLRSFEVGDGEAELRLEATRGLDGFRPLHPALLDMALGAAQAALAPPGVDAARLLPFRYGRIDVLAPLPARITSRQRARAADDSLVLDIDVLDDTGQACVRVRDFELRAARRLSAPARARRASTPGSALLDVGFRDGFGSGEALDAIGTVLAHPLPSQVALARRPVDVLVADTRRAAHAVDAAHEAGGVIATPVPRRVGGTPFAPAETPVQARMVALWERLLDLSGIGVEDDFFALGGHSLLLTRALSRLKREDGIALPIDAAFEAPRIRAWSALAEQAGAASSIDATPLPPLRPAPRIAGADGCFRFPTTHSQRQLFYVQATAPDNTAYNIPFAFTLRGALDRDALAGAIGDVVAAHEALRTHFEIVDGHVLQVVDPFAAPMHEQVDLSAMPEVERRSALAEVRELVARHVFDLGAAPPCLFLTVKLAPEEHVLLFCLHHVLVDHLAVLHIGRALEERYAQRRRGSAPAIPAPALQLPDYAVWQAATLDAKALAQRLPHWMETLAPCPTVLSLPTDRPRPPRQDFSGAEHRLALSVATSARLRAFSQSAQQTPFVVMLAALARVMRELSGQSRLVIGCPFANRNAEELEPVVGLFMNLLPLGLHLPEGQTFDELLAQVRRQVTRTQAVQDTPFPAILQALGVPRDVSRNPLVQVWYTLQEAPMALRFDGLDVTSEALPNGGAKLDLSFWFWDDGERVRGLVEYATALYDDATIGALVEKLETTLAASLESTPVDTAQTVVE
jgi:acyl transferase domain-containing protein